MRIEVAEDVIWRDLGEEVVIVNLASNNYFGLSGAGGQMWRQLAEHGSLEQTVGALVEEFEADAETLRADLDELVRELGERSLVTIVADNSAAPAASKLTIPTISKRPATPKKKPAAKKPAAKTASRIKAASVVKKKASSVKQRKR